MVFLLIGSIILFASSIILTIKYGKYDDAGACAIFIFISGFLMLVMTCLVPVKYKNEANMSERTRVKQETINEIIKEGASDREKAVLVTTIIQMNDEIKELQLDNQHWFWALGTPDSVDDLKMLEMYCTCPK
jgi:hypothetical protein